MLKIKQTVLVVFLFLLLVASVVCLCLTRYTYSPVMANESEDAVEIPKVPIIMYHSVLKSAKKRINYGFSMTMTI